MQNNKKWETLVSIVIWMVILSFIILALMSIIINSKDTLKTYDNSRYLTILKNNASNILTKLDTENFWENDYFYLYKDKTNKEFKIFTWSDDTSNPNYNNYLYKYINKYWEKVNINTYPWSIYSRFFWIEREDISIDWEKNQIIKAHIKKLKRNY